MEIFKILFIVLISSVSLFAQNGCYNTELNLSGLQINNDSLEVLSDRINSYMPDGADTVFSVVSVAEYTLDGFKQASDRDRWKSDLLNRLYSENPYHLIFWWKGTPDQIFKDLEVKFDYPRDKQFGNCFTGSRVTLIEAKLQNMVDSIKQVEGWNQNYTIVEENVLILLNREVLKVKNCCYESRRNECSLCHSPDEVALIKHHLGIYDFPGAFDLELSNYSDEEIPESAQGFCFDFLNQKLLYGDVSIDLREEFSAYRESINQTNNYLYITTDDYFCDQSGPEEGDESWSFINVSDQEGVPMLELRHHKADDYQSFAEHLVIRFPEIFGYLMAPILLPDTSLIEFEPGDRGSVDNAFISGSGAFVKQYNDQSENSYRLEDIQFVKHGNPSLLPKSLYSFTFQQVKYFSCRSWDGQYLGYYNSAVFNEISGLKGPISTRKISSTFPEFTSTENWCVVTSTNPLTKVLSIDEDCRGTAIVSWNDQPLSFNVVGPERPRIEVPPNREVISYTSGFTSLLCCELGWEYINEFYNSTDDEDVRQELIRIGEHICEIGDGVFGEYNGSHVWGPLGGYDVLGEYIKHDFSQHQNLSVSYLKEVNLKWESYKWNILGDLDLILSNIDGEFNYNQSPKGWWQLKLFIDNLEDIETAFILPGQRKETIKFLTYHLDKRINPAPGSSLANLTPTTEPTILKLLEEVGDLNKPDFSRVLFNDSQLLSNIFRGYSDIGALGGIDNNFKLLIEKLMVLFSEYDPVFVNPIPPNGSVEKVVVLGEAHENTFRCPALINGDCFGEYTIAKRILDSPSSDFCRPIVSQAEILSFSGPVDYVVVRVLEDEYDGIVNLPAGDYYFPSFFFCYLTEERINDELRILINGGVTILVTALTLGEAVWGQGIARIVAVVEIASATTFYTAKQFVLSQSCIDLFDNASEYNSFKDGFLSVERVANRAIIVASLGTAIAPVLRTSLRAKKAVDFPSSLPDAERPDLILNRMADNLGERIFDDLPAVSSFVESIKLNPDYEDIVKALREIRGKNIDDDLLQDLAQDLSRNSDLLSGSNTLQKVQGYELFSRYGDETMTPFRSNPDVLNELAKDLKDNQGLKSFIENNDSGIDAWKHSNDAYPNQNFLCN